MRSASASRIGRLARATLLRRVRRPEEIEALFAEEPGTYLLTDFLVKSFRRTVISELGLDRHPELWGDYFGNYRRVVWLANSTRRSSKLKPAHCRRFGLPLVIVKVGTVSLEIELEALLGTAVITAQQPQSSERRDRRA